MQEVSGPVPADGAATSDEAAPPRPNEPSWIIVRRDSNERSERIGRICVDYPISLPGQSDSCPKRGLGEFGFKWIGLAVRM